MHKLVINMLSVIFIDLASTLTFPIISLIVQDHEDFLPIPFEILVSSLDQTGDWALRINDILHDKAPPIFHVQERIEHTCIETACNVRQNLFPSPIHGWRGGAR
jgi:hypothetical protein